MNTKIKPDMGRRALLRSGSGTLIALTLAPGGMILGSGNAWAAEAKTLKPESFATLIQACRDIYPHDALADAYYAKVVEGFDAAAAEDDTQLTLFEEGVALLDQSAMSAHGANYRTVGWEIQRVNILRSMESDPFFQKLRGTLVTGIYNNPDVCPMFGYEGESVSKGGYFNRGFDDIDWLDQV